MKKSTIWLSYDLGLDGDYNGMYYFLDTYKSKECGDSIAMFEYEFKDNGSEELEYEIRRTVKIRNTDRVYVIFMNKERKVTSAGFLSGKRKIAPWNGYAQPINDINDF